MGNGKIQKSSSNTGITESNDCYSIAGATYGVYADKSCKEQLATLTADNSGSTETVELKAATYYVKETKAPKMCIRDRAKTQLKICGITRAQDVIFCCRHGVDIIDFVTEYPVPVAWDLTRDQTERLMANVTGGTKTCVVSGGSRDKILTLAKKLRPDYIQLQEHETLVAVSYTHIDVYKRQILISSVANVLGIIHM